MISNAYFMPVIHYVAGLMRKKISQGFSSWKRPFKKEFVTKYWSNFHLLKAALMKCCRKRTHSDLWSGWSSLRVTCVWWMTLILNFALVTSTLRFWWAALVNIFSSDNERDNGYPLSVFCTNVNKFTPYAITYVTVWISVRSICLTMAAGW